MTASIESEHSTILTPRCVTPREDIGSRLGRVGLHDSMT